VTPAVRERAESLEKTPRCSATSRRARRAAVHLADPRIRAAADDAEPKRAAESLFEIAHVVCAREIENRSTYVEAQRERA
jgi:hypothetical protein